MQGRMRCIECGCLIRQIGAVPPKTYECITCGNVFRATEENIIKAENACGKHPTESVSKDNRPNYIKPSWAKMVGNR